MSYVCPDCGDGINNCSCLSNELAKQLAELKAENEVFSQKNAELEKIILVEMPKLQARIEELEYQLEEQHYEEYGDRESIFFGKKKT